MDNKKGQVIMDFLVTYGWAILASIIIIAVLFFYFPPSKLDISNNKSTSYNPLHSIPESTLNEVCKNITGNENATFNSESIDAIHFDCKLNMPSSDKRIRIIP